MCEILEVWDYTKWRSEQPERPFEEIVADVLSLQDKMVRGIIDDAGRPVGDNDYATPNP